MTLEPDHSLQEVARVTGMSTRWLRDRCKPEHPEFIEHLRYGHKIRFTADQVEKLRASHTKTPVEASITTGPKKHAP